VENVINAHPILRTSFVEIRDPSAHFLWRRLFTIGEELIFPLQPEGEAGRSLIDHELEREGTIDVERLAFHNSVAISDGKTLI